MPNGNTSTITDSSAVGHEIFFLFGPRATGKTTLIRQQLEGNATVIDLLDSRLYLRLSRSPQDLQALIAANPSDIIVVDEIQRVPELLNEIHRLIEAKKLTFLLTGSSARKLRRGNANLLAGRVWEARMFPLIYKEISNFDFASKPIDAMPPSWPVCTVPGN